MALKFFKTFEKDNLADGKKFVDHYTPDEAVTVKRIYIVEKAGTTLRKSTFYFKTPAIVHTRELIPASLLGPDIMVTPEINLALKAAERLDFTLENREGVTISVYVVLECE